MLQMLSLDIDFFKKYVIIILRKTLIDFLEVIMRNKRVFSILLAGFLAVSMGNSVWASTEDEIAYAREQKQAAQSGLAQTEAAISSLESKKQELENYLAELNAQYEELNSSLAELEKEAAAKEEELARVKKELKKAKADAEEQYEAMKIRIVYMYEHGGSSMLESLLSSGSIAEFLNQAENVSQISQYDRDMLQKYEETSDRIKEQEQQIEEENEAIARLQSEKESKQQEVQALAANTSANISSYINQISATEEEASALMAQINSADSNIASLMEKAAAEAAAAEAAASAEESVSEESQTLPDYDPETDTMDSAGSSTGGEVIVEEDGSDLYGEDDGTYEEEDTGSTEDSSYTEESSSGSGSGTYLGNFRLTGYCNCAKCCGTAGNATASGAMPAAGHTVAMAGVPFGTQLSINGTIYTVEDLGTPYGHVDIYFDSHEEALSFGSQYADVYQVN